MCINISSNHSPEPLQRAGININYGRVGRFSTMCQFINRDMCNSLPQHFGLPAQFKYVKCKKGMIDDKEYQSKRGLLGFFRVR